MKSASEKVIVPLMRAYVSEARRNHNMASSAHPFVRGYIAEIYQSLEKFMPQHLKLDIDRLSRSEALASERYLAESIGEAHARQIDASTRKEFAASFKRHNATQLNASSCLWSSIVEFVAAHEMQHLERCRRYASADG